MKTGLNSLAEKVAILQATTDVQDTFEQFIQVMLAHGFDKIFAGRGTPERNGAQLLNRLFFAHGLDDYMEDYTEKKYVNIDPILAHCAKTQRPFRWRDAYTNLTPEQVAHVKESYKHGLKYGIIFPVMTRSGLMGLTSLGRSTEFNLTLEQLVELETLSRYFFEHIDTLMGDDVEGAIYNLTQKEREVLDLVAQGKTNWEIGQILSISQYSVRDYLKSISDRFNTSNRTHTVVRAIQLGLLVP